MLLTREADTAVTWVYFDDRFPASRKVAGLSHGAFRLHVHAIFWSHVNRTDGLIARGDIGLIVPGLRNPARYAAECARRPVWHESSFNCPSKHCPAPADGDGWVIHDYWQLHPSRAEAAARAEHVAARKSAGGTLGNHRRWHVGQGTVHPGCPWCYPSDTDRTPIGAGSEGADRTRIALSLSQSDPPVVRDLSPRYARTGDDDDQVVRAVQGALLARTGLPVSAAHARRVAALILAGRATRNPAAYVAQAITVEPDPRARFIRLPAAPVPWPPWCGKCDPDTRQADSDDGTGRRARCPACHPLTQGGQP